MTHDFDRPYWEDHWRHAHHGAVDPNPHLVHETAGLTPGTALDAGCGAGTEAVWLAARGWDVTAVDIASSVLDRAAATAADVTWVRADLTTWTPATAFDLVVTHYAHPAMPQLDFYARISEWVAPGGTLLVVGHLHTAAGHQPAEASATAEGVTARLAAATWEIATAEEHARTVTAPDGRAVPLHDVVVRATRRP